MSPAIRPCTRTVVYTDPMRVALARETLDEVAAEGYVLCGHLAALWSVMGTRYDGETLTVELSAVDPHVIDPRVSVPDLPMPDASA